MNPLIQFKKTTILPILFAQALICFALSPAARELLGTTQRLARNP